MQPRCITPGCNRIQAGHYRCRPHERDALTGVPVAEQAARLQRFRAFITPDQDTGCWVWTGGTNPDGYAMFTAGGSWLAHRFAYVWFYGGTAPRLVLDHLCNRVDCVRPDHLWPVTNGTNIRLMHERAGAGDQDYWQHSRITPYSLPMIQWAASVGLPWGKPAHRDTLAA